ncbi:MAG: DUF4238 domain-containing protein [Parasphingopyxis sp.]|uniref:DUF4238 domain-containing protein n=1 Tax=Parasphingopyxis sp. TaxID=1920299 RepID=UPI0032EB4A8B
MAAINEYRRNHYVPIWYQEKFLLPDMPQRKFKYLDLQPDAVIDPRGRKHAKTALRRWGPTFCFREEDLYTTSIGPWFSTEIEQRFFGEIDDRGRRAVEYWEGFALPNISHDAFTDLIRFMTVQKLRTPKGLAHLARATGVSSKNRVLMELQRFQHVYGAIWAEAEWAIADASACETKLLLSDHPVTVYNLRCFPGAPRCSGGRDPEPWLNGTHTFFPLSSEKLLILTNTSWVRNPYGDPIKNRPNPNPMRTGVFKFTDVQTGRQLTEQEVLEINYVIKMRARRYIAAPVEEWLYPEKHLTSTHWSKLGNGLLFMPDPRSVSFTSEIIMGGYPDGRPADRWDEYGLRPGQPGFGDEKRRARESTTFEAFKGEFARLFGQKHRGAGVSFGRRVEEDSAEYHAELLRQERPDLSKSRTRR